MAFTQRSTSEVIITAVLQSILDAVDAILTILTGSTAQIVPNSPTSASVGITSSLVISANSSRKTLAIVNASNNRVSFGFGATAVLDSGITLYPGGSLVLDRENILITDVYAIASGASSTISIQESV